MKNTSTVVDETLQRELAQYGIFRAEAVKNTSEANPFFGVRKQGQEYKTKYGTSIEAIQKANMQVAIVAPDNESFDMLITKNFSEAISKASPDDLRSYLRSIVDRA